MTVFCSFSDLKTSFLDMSYAVRRLFLDMGRTQGWNSKNGSV